MRAPGTCLLCGKGWNEPSPECAHHPVGNADITAPCTRCGAADHCFINCRRDDPRTTSLLHVLDRIALELEIRNRFILWESLAPAVAIDPVEYEAARVALNATMSKRKRNECP